MLRSEVDRINRLIAFVRQFNRIKFSHNQLIIPQEYLAVVALLEALLPDEYRNTNYNSIELTGNPTPEHMGDLIVPMIERSINKTISRDVKFKLESVDTSLFEPSEISDVSSTETVDSPPQQVSDCDEPFNKKTKI